MSQPNKKELALEILSVYYKDPSKRSVRSKLCVYLSPNGNKCAAGSMLTDKCLNKIVEAGDIMNQRTFHFIPKKIVEFLPKYKGVFNNNEIRWMQSVHDTALKPENVGVHVSIYLSKDALFTFKELVDYSSTH